MDRCSKCGVEYSGGPHACGRAQAAIDTLFVERDDPPDFEAESSLYEVGAVIGQYRLLGLLGEGAIGRVYLAEHMALGRRVALKMVRSELARKDSIVERFFGEARAVNQIRHENIVEITDFVREDEVGRSYYIMELLEGETLRGLLDEAKVLPLERTLAIAHQIAGALEAVHAQGIVHRDLKPENIFLTSRAGRSDFVKLLDFGAAKMSDLGGGRRRQLTQAGTLVGTPHYMAPEQTFGTEVDARADIYALGVLIYEMSTGRPPLDGANVTEILLAQRNDTPVRPKDLAPVPESLERLILACLAKSANERPQSMAEVRSALEEIIRPQPRSRAGRALAVTALLAGVALAAFTLIDHPAREIPIATPQASSSPPPVTPASHVSITFRSKPDGATVLFDHAPVGTTPLTTQLERSDRPVTYELRLRGHASLIDVVRPTTDSTVAVVLAEISRPAPAPRARPKKVKKHRSRRPAPPPADEQKNGIGLGDMRDPFSGK